MYYLGSRYYDPEIGRFISPDVFICTGQGLLGANMFAYCLNNPVNRTDKTGHDAASIVSEWKTMIWWLTLVDGPFPKGDILFFLGVFILSFFAFQEQINNPIISFDNYEHTSFNEIIYQNKAGDGVTEHTNGHKNWQKHSNPRSGRLTTKNRKKKSWKPNPNPKQRLILPFDRFDEDNEDEGTFEGSSQFYEIVHSLK